jgi:hypothetical protein
MADVTVQGGAAAAGSSGVLTVILGAEAKRRGVEIGPDELIAFAAILAPVLHVGSRFVAAGVSKLSQRWFGTDVSTPPPPPAAAA